MISSAFLKSSPTQKILPIYKSKLPFLKSPGVIRNVIRRVIIDEIRIIKRNVFKFIPKKIIAENRITKTLPNMNRIIREEKSINLKKSIL